MSHPSSEAATINEEQSPDNISETKDNGPSEEKPRVDTSDDDTSQYITGVKLYTVIAGLTMVAFLMMLDSTIVTTVRCTFIPLDSN
jgi:hypothetical protein